MRHLLLLIVLSCVVINYSLVDRLHIQRDKNALSAMPSLQGVPPEIIFATTALGAFRGLLVDALWLRATSMRDRGEFFELVQLSDWIGKLEPRMPKIWSFNAWNLAYNISVELPTSAERWNWVNQGMKVLKEKGIPYNPKCADLYEELSWIIYHKIGQYTDDHNNYYKLRLADEIDRVMGSKSATEILEKYPDMAKRIKDELSLDVSFMVELENRFGFFDWRFPDALAIYWAQKGRPFAKANTIKNMDRITYSGLQNCFRRGRLFIARDDNGNAISFYSVPNFSFVNAVIKLFEANLKSFGRKVGVVSAYKYFLEEALTTAYIYGDKKTASIIMLKLQEQFPKDKKYKKSFNTVAQRLLMEGIKEANRDDLYNYITGYLTNAYVHLGWGESEASKQMEFIAAKLYKYFEKTFQSKGQTLPRFDLLRTQALRQANMILPHKLRMKMELIKKME